MKQLFDIKLTSNVEFKRDLNEILNVLHGSGLYGLFETRSEYAYAFVDYIQAHLKWKTKEQFKKVFGSLRNDPAEIKAEYKEYFSKLRKALRTHPYLVFSIG